ncbi:hypothetical protein BDV25DRAFT_36870 [Aspergillus avenaceus]|uniref:Uncharacterized protein n=1 Tax=Aspergillus avenaceus TaxID=36643 RepID=A0A5N6TLJ4_ASPAV|nr:hypothetical protein BDV25DRAFT_36870 [Aspergillus avenaceus]
MGRSKNGSSLRAFFFMCILCTLYDSYALLSFFFFFLTVVSWVGRLWLLLRDFNQSIGRSHKLGMFIVLCVKEKEKGKNKETREQ